MSEDEEEAFDIYGSTRRTTAPPPVYTLPCFTNLIASLCELVPPPFEPVDIHVHVAEDNTA